MEKIKHNLIINDMQLFDKMLKYQENSKGIYKPGPYANHRIKKSVKEIKKNGLNEFRSHTSIIGTTYADNVILNSEIFYKYTWKAIFLFLIKLFFPFNKMLQNQVYQTKLIFDKYLQSVKILLKNSDTYFNLNKNFKIPNNTLKGGSEVYVNLNGGKKSLKYIQVLSELSIVTEKNDYTLGSSYIEIGAGFGTNIHLILENFKNIKKIILIDIAPALYVQTQYLKSFFGDNVYSFDLFESEKQISFKEDNSLEIYCLLPAQIEKIKYKFDFIHNSHSFVEMPEKIVENYVCYLEKLSHPKSKYSIISFNSYREGSTLNPNSIPSYFKKTKLKKIIATDIFEEYEFLFFYN